MTKKYNLGTPSNPIFKEMFRRHAISTGALILAIELLERDYNYALLQAQEHTAKANMAWGFVIKRYSSSYFSIKK